MTVNDFPEPHDDPNVLFRLLRRYEWQPAPRSNDQPYEVWRHRYSDSDILVPVDPSKSDYQQLLRRAYEALVYEQGADVEQVATTIQVRRRSTLEATRWTKESVLDTGMIQWNVGQRLHEVARSALGASAKAAQKPKQYYGNTQPYISRKLIEATLMGQSELGSYVVTAYIPAEERFFFSQTSEEARQSKLIDVESRSGAEIIDKLDEVVGAVRAKLDEFRRDPRSSIFEEIIPLGFSHEIAVALASLSDHGEGAVNIVRAPRPNTTMESTTEYSFSATESLVLEQVGESLRLAADPEPVNLVGEVTLLEHVANVGEHTVRLHVANQPRLRTVRMILSPEQYEVAIDAHRNDLPLRASGIIERQGNYNWLREPSRVRIISDFTNDDDVLPDDDGEQTRSDQDPLF